MKKFLILIFIMVLSLGVVACSPETTEEEVIDEDPVTEVPEDDEDEEVDEEAKEDEDLEEIDEDIDEDEEEDEIVDPEPETSKETVTLYFVDEEFVITGAESDEIVLTEEREVEYGDTSLEEAIVRELMEGPEGDDLYTLIPEESELLGVEVEDGTAFVDFASEGLGGGSMQEIYTIEQIVYSLTELDNVDRVQFLIDGQKSETLMGHMEISEPFERPEE